MAAFGCFLSLSVAHGDQTWSGGSNRWDVGNTSDWSGSTWGESYNPGTDTVTNPGNMAVFTSAGGTITVDDTQPGGSVAATALYFANNNNGAYDLKGDTIYTDDGFNGTTIEVAGGSGPVTIDSNVDQINGNATTYAANSFPGDNQHIDNDSSSDLTLNGTLDYENQTTLFMAANGTGKIIVNGTINANTSGLYLLGGGTYEFGASSNLTALDSAHNGTNLSLIDFAGTVLLDADTFLGASAFTIGGGNGDAPHGIFTNGAFIGTQNITDERATGELGGNAAVASGWSGAVYLDNGPNTLTFSQVAGGRFTYSSTAFGVGGVGIDGRNGTYLITSGDGTVVLGSGNSYSGNDTLAADLQAAQTLITNTTASGSAFGTNTGIVQLEAGKLLGGSGFSSQKVVAEGVAGTTGASIIAPGDPGQANLGIHASIGTLTLAGGLEADNGLTMDFKLNGDAFGGPQSGVNNDFLIASSLTTDGTITINLTALDALQTGSGNIYTLIQDNGDWDGTPTFAINAPAGYALDPTYGNGLGYVFDPTPGAGSLSVELIAVPEPSTYAMMLGGLLLLGFCVRRRIATIG